MVKKIYRPLKSADLNPPAPQADNKLEAKEFSPQKYFSINEEFRPQYSEIHKGGNYFYQNAVMTSLVVLSSPLISKHSIFSFNSETSNPLDASGLGLAPFRAVFSAPSPTSAIIPYQPTIAPASKLNLGQENYLPLASTSSSSNSAPIESLPFSISEDFFVSNGLSSTPSELIEESEVPSIPTTPTPTTPILLSLPTIAGVEDAAISLPLANAFVNLGTLSSITISGLPSTATLSAGELQADGTWILTPADLVNLTLTAHEDATFTMQVTALGVNANNVSITINANLPMTFTPAAAIPVSLSLPTIAGVEDAAVSLDINSALTNLGTLSSITISGLPSTASLSAGQLQQNGTWVLTPNDLANLTLTNREDTNFTMQITASGIDANNDDIAISANLPMTFSPAAAIPVSLSLPTIAGVEDAAVSLDINSALTNLGTLSSITISGLSSTASLSAGQLQQNGTWVLTPNDLANLTLTNREDTNFTMQITASGIDANNDDIAISANLPMTFSPAAAIPISLSLPTIVGVEDAAISLDINSALTNLGALSSITISGLPSTASLSAGQLQANGTWILTPNDLNNLTLTNREDTNFTMQITASGIDANNDDIAISANLPMTFSPAAAIPISLSLPTIVGVEDAAISLDINSALTNLGALSSITISGLPSTASLSAGQLQQNGTWVLTPNDLNNLTLTNREDTNFTMQITASGIDSNNDDIAISANLPFTFSPAAAIPVSLSLPTVVGVEDAAVSLSIADPLSQLGTLSSITISGLPSTASLSAGQLQQNGTWILTPNDLANLTLTNREVTNFTMQITVSGIDANNDDIAISANLPFTFTPAAAIPVSLSLPSIAGVEDAAVSLDINSALTNLGTLSSITISGLPSTASLSAGQLQQNGTWLLTPANLANLTLTNREDTNFTMQITASGIDSNNDDIAISANLPMTFTPAAAIPVSLSLPTIAGVEDAAISLSIADPLSQLGTLSSITISGLPGTATLSAGQLQQNGTWILTPNDLANLTLTNREETNFTMQITASGIDSNNDDIAISANLPMTFTPAAAIPVSLSLPTIVGVEDAAVSLDINSALTNLGTLSSVTISGLPSTATLSAGELQANGTWILTPNDLANLTLTNREETNFTMQITASGIDSNNDDIAISANLPMTFTPAAAIPVSLSLPTIAGVEDTAISLDINSALTNLGTISSVTISGLPSTASLSAGQLQQNGIWLLTSSDLNNLTLTNREDTNFTMQITASGIDSNNDDIAISANLPMTFTPAAAIPVSLSLPTIAGVEDAAVSLAIADPLSQLGTLSSITISGLPGTATLSAGQLQQNGTWILTPNDLANLTLTNREDTNFTMQITASGIDSNNDDIAISASLPVTFTPAPAIPISISLPPITGVEDAAISLSIADPLSQLGTLSSITISGLPSSAVLSAGQLQANGSWILTSANLANLTLTASENTDFTLQIRAAGIDANNDDIVISTNIPLIIQSAEPIPIHVSFDTINGIEDSPIDLDISLPFINTVSEIIISGIPAGTTLNHGTRQANGSWSLSVNDLQNLTITFADDVNVNLQISAQAQDSNGNNIVIQGELPAIIADTPSANPTSVTASFANIYGIENTAMQFNITDNLPFFENIDNVRITGVPANATFSKGHRNGDGSWTFTTNELSGVTLSTTNENDFTLQISANTYDNNGNVIEIDGSVKIVVVPEFEIHPQNLPVNVAFTSAGGFEKTFIPLDIDLPFTSSISSINISGVPATAILSSGVKNANGSWTVTSSQLNGLTIKPTTDADFNLQITATAQDSSGNSLALQGSLAVNVVAAPASETTSITATLQSISGYAKHLIALNLDDNLPFANNITSATISNVPSTAVLSAGVKNADGTWTVTKAQLRGLTIKPTTDADFNLSITAVGMGSTQNPINVATTLSVVVNPDLGTTYTPLTLTNITGAEDTSISLNIYNAINTASAGKFTSVNIYGVPSSATLTEGSKQSDGSWRVNKNRLSATRVTVTDDTDFSLQVVVKVTGQNDIIGELAVVVDPNASTIVDSYSLVITEPPARGFEDAAINLNLDNTLLGVGTITSVTVTGVPSTATLSAGVKQANGSWILTGSQLTNLKITPTTDQDFTLNFSATGKDAQNNNLTIQGTQSVAVETAIVEATPLPANLNFSLAALAGMEDGPIALHLAESLPFSSTLSSITISNVPSSATLSAGTHNANGTWTLRAQDLTGLTITTMNDTDLNLQIAAQTLNNGITFTYQATLPIVVETVEAPPAEFLSAPLSFSPITGVEDNAIDLNLDLTIPFIESVSEITISGIPASASLSAGVKQGNGSWIVSAESLNALKLLPTTDTDISLGISANAEDDQGNTIHMQGTLAVTVDPEIIEPNEPTSITIPLGAVMASEDNSFFLNLDSSLPFADSISEVEIFGLPSSASLSSGIQQLDGSWLLSGEQLTGLKLTTTSDLGFNLQISALATDNHGNSLLMQGELPIIQPTEFSDSEFASSLMANLNVGDNFYNENLDIIPNLLEPELTESDWLTASDSSTEQANNMSSSKNSSDWTKEVEHAGNENLVEPMSSPNTLPKDEPSINVDENNDLNKT